MNEPEFWILACIACLLSLVVLSLASCLFLVRRVGSLTRAQAATDDRLARLSYDLHRLERRGSDPYRGQPGGGPVAAFEVRPMELISVPDLGDSGEAEADSSLAEKHADVWALVEEGLSTHDIARRTGKPIGQVEVIAGLYRQGRGWNARARHDDA